MTDMLPGIFWIITVALCLVLCSIVVVQSRYFDAERPVNPVPWSVTALHMGTLVCAMVPYVLFKQLSARITPVVRDFYVQQAWLSGIILIVLIAVELMLMIMQSKRASASEQHSPDASNSHGAKDATTPTTKKKSDDSSNDSRN